MVVFISLWTIDIILNFSQPFFLNSLPLTIFFFKTTAVFVFSTEMTVCRFNPNYGYVLKFYLEYGCFPVPRQQLFNISAKTTIL